MKASAFRAHYNAPQDAAEYGDATADCGKPGWAFRGAAVDGAEGMN
jgi:hypothetical protein